MGCTNKDNLVNDSNMEEGSDNEIHSPEDNDFTDRMSDGDVGGVGSCERDEDNLDTSSSSSSSDDNNNNDCTRNECREIRLAELLREIFTGDGIGGDVNLLFHQTERANGVLWWLQALDLQVIGACRADERLKPLLKLNVTRTAADNWLLSLLNQHFDAPEVGMLARCLCVPLVSVRAGKIFKKGKLLCPTTKSDFESSRVAIEYIPVDSSGRSFLIKLPRGQVSYFWCSEKSKVYGDELLAKMKDLLQRKPSLSQLTGISESRLSRFAAHLHSDLLGSESAVSLSPGVSSPALLDGPFASCPQTESVLASNPQDTTHSANCHSSPYVGSVLVTDCGSVALSSTNDSTKSSSPALSGDEKVSEGNSYLHLLAASLPDTIPIGLPSSFSSLPFPVPLNKVPASSLSHFSPYYCWCPPCSSTLQYAVAPNLPSTSIEALPPLSSLLSATRSSSSLPNLPLDIVSFPPLDPQALLPDPITQIPLPVSSFITKPSSQQIPTFITFMSDPIVHIPVIDVCSSGQGYLVSAGPTISTTIAPMLPPLVSPLSSEAESLVEKGARETLRLLIGSTQSGASLMEMLPTALTTTGQGLSYIQGRKQGALFAGSRGFYIGTQDVDAVATGASIIGLLEQEVSAAEGENSGGKFRRNDTDDVENLEDDQSLVDVSEEVSENAG